MLAAAVFLCAACERDASAELGVDPPSAARFGLSPVTSAPGEGATASVRLPPPGATVGSPIRVEGLVAPGEPMRLAAQISSRDLDGTWRWRGNAVLEQSGAAFTGDVPYVLDEAQAGRLEVLKVDEAGGTLVLATVEISLEAAGGGDDG